MTDRNGTVLLPPELAGRVGLSGDLFAAFGIRRVTADAAPWPDAPPGVIGLSADLIGQLGIPSDQSYQVLTSRNTLRLGPLIGILAAESSGELKADRLRALANHLLGTSGGLFVAFDRSSLDPDEGQVAGYRYRPGPRESWEPGVFPLPRVIFRRYGVRLGNAFQPLAARGVTIFNERLFHKGEAWRWTVAEPSLRAHVPETAPLTGIDSVLSLLARYQAVYIKPVWGSLAAGVSRVRRLDGGGGFEATVPGRDPVACPDEADLRAVLRPHLPRPGIVQQGLPLATVGDRLVDFRVILQKDGSGSWTVPGMVGRCGTAGLHVSNMAAGGFPLAAEQALALLFGPHPVTLFQRKQELVRLALSVGRAIDRSGLLVGDLGLDIAYDEARHPWVIEANNRDPDHNIGWEAGDWPLFYRIRTLPLDYACCLAGFGTGGFGEEDRSQ